MFSFHKPKIYRSINGCCICKAKSSSSRFTDSKKYEPEFERCFRISEKRSGEICNACVLLVKRWKKLPIGTNRDWHHVVDARAGPGTKCTTKNKIKTERKPAKKLRLRLCRSKHISTEVLSDDVAAFRSFQYFLVLCVFLVYFFGIKRILVAVFALDIITFLLEISIFSLVES
ncbi:UNVERIFIED_CONTAM: Fam60a [Trichonephila clavipes]